MLSLSMNTSEKIEDFIKEKEQVSAKEIINRFEISKQAVFKHLSKLLQEEKIKKIGRPPRVFYFIPEKKYEATEREKGIEYDDKLKDIIAFIEENFFDITSIGEIKTGWKGFLNWCLKRNQEIKKSAEDYFSIIHKYKKIRRDGLINGMKKMKDTFNKVYLDHIFYIDFYSIERFGKTKLGKILLYAKQSQDRKMMKVISEEIKPYVQKIIKKYKIDAVAFIPPSVKRERQIMKEIENSLNLDLQKINIFKIKTEVIIPQKTLNKLEDRIKNAQTVFFIEEEKKYNNILLIDDAVGSGATFNEIAFKIRKRNIIKGKIIGLAIVGSLKGFDIISEV